MRSRHLLPVLLVAFVAALGISFFASTPARAAGTRTSAAASASPPTTTYRDEPTTLQLPPVETKAPADTVPPGPTPPTTISLATSNEALGRLLFQTNCASCHAVNAEGSARAPSLVGLGAATIDFWVSTGRMPLSRPEAEPEPKPARFNRPQTLDIAKYVSSLGGGGGEGIPNVDLRGANMGAGFSLFVTNCAGCHAVTGRGDALSNGLYAPSLVSATPTQVAEAMRTGPNNMPIFAPGQLTQRQLLDIVYYVTKGGIQHPYNRGGANLGLVGPIAEGFVGIFAGLGAMLAVLWWIGDRTAKARP